MKASFVSSSAVSEAMRYSLMKTQAALAKAQKEQTTGFFADKGQALGARSSQSVTFNRELERIQGIVDSNTRAAARLSSTQIALSQVSDTAQNFLSLLATVISGNAMPHVVTNGAKHMLASLNAMFNTSMDGEYLFAGINTDVKPLNDLQDPASSGKIAFDDAFFNRFGFTASDPAASSITAADMDDFLTNIVEPQFLGAGWENWSNASDQVIVSRISLSDTTETSVSANGAAPRKLAMVATLMNEMMTGNLNTAASKALVERSFALVGEAISDLVKQRSEVGIAEKRVADASDRLEQQSTLIEKHLLATEGVDPYEAAARVSDLLSHIETAYAITARIQQLSLLRYLS